MLFAISKCKNITVYFINDQKINAPSNVVYILAVLERFTVGFTDNILPSNRLELAEHKALNSRV